MSSGHQAGAQPSRSSGDAGPRPPGHQHRTRVTQGQLVEAAAFPSPVPLIDIGVNLMDKSFQGVRHRRMLGWGQATCALQHQPTSSSDAYRAPCEH